jgi:hypothetical protein
MITRFYDFSGLIVEFEIVRLIYHSLEKPEYTHLFNRPSQIRVIFRKMKLIMMF